MSLVMDLRQIQLPSIEERQRDWDKAYRRLGARANLRTNLATGPGQLTLAEYHRGERQRINQLMAVVTPNIREIDSYYEQFQIVPGSSTVEPKLIVEMCPGYGNLSAGPGELVVEACTSGYRLLAVDFSKYALSAWKRRVSELLRRRKVSYCADSIEIQHGRMHEFISTLTDESVDAMLIFQALQHSSLEELDVICAQLKRVLKPWGKVIVQLPCQENNDAANFSERTILWPRSYLCAKLRPLELLECHVVPVFDEKEQSTIAVFGNPAYAHK